MRYGYAKNWGNWIKYNKKENIDYLSIVLKKKCNTISCKVYVETEDTCGKSQRKNVDVFSRRTFHKL